MKRYTAFHREEEITRFMLIEALGILHTGLPELAWLLKTKLFALSTLHATLFNGPKWETLQVGLYASVDSLIKNFQNMPSFILVMVHESCPSLSKSLDMASGETNIYLTITEPGRKSSANFLVTPQHHAEPLDQLFRKALEHVDYACRLDSKFGTSHNLVFT